MAKVSLNTRSIPTFDDMSDDEDSAASCSESCDDESSNGSVDPEDITVMGADDENDGTDKDRGQKPPKAVASIHSWLNLLLVTVLTSGTILSVLAHVILSRVDDLSEDHFEMVSFLSDTLTTTNTMLIQPPTVSLQHVFSCQPCSFAFH